MFIVTVWSAGNALEMSGADFSTKLFWANMQYIAYCFSPVSLFALCMQFTGYDRFIRNGNLRWLLVLPSIIIILIWTDPLHGLMRYDMHLDFSGAFPVIAKEYGPVFYIHAAYAHALNITAWVLLTLAVFYRKTVYRKQAVLLLLGVSMIVVPNVLYILGLSPIKRFDITPLFFGPAAILMAWAIFRYKMFDLVPLARARVFENMDNGVMVLDLQNRVLDMNTAFEKIIGLPSSQIAAQNAEDVCCRIPELSKACGDRNVMHTEFSVELNGSCRIYEAMLSLLTSGKGEIVGRLVVIYEISEKKRAQQMHLEQERRLAAAQERERMARDLHDNLGQILGFINFQAQGIRQELKNAGIETGIKRIDHLVDVTQSAHSEIRKYIRDTRNSAIMERDFASAVSNEIKSFEERAGVNAQLVMPASMDMERLEPRVRLNILYIIKEALNNVQKHACAKHVTILLDIKQGELRFSIDDDGKGFDTTLHGRCNTFGLNIMHERAEEIGGKLYIESAPGKGSRITLCIPTAEGEDKNSETDACGRPSTVYGRP
jgi:PAS domain S-box-containing protein